MQRLIEDFLLQIKMPKLQRARAPLSKPVPQRLGLTSNACHCHLCSWFVQKGQLAAKQVQELSGGGWCRKQVRTEGLPPCCCPIGAASAPPPRVCLRAPSVHPSPLCMMAWQPCMRRQPAQRGRLGPSLLLSLASMMRPYRWAGCYRF